MEGWRKMMLLMVLTGEDTVEAMESRLLLGRDEAEDERRKEVRRVDGEKREAIAWNLEDCILTRSVGPGRRVTMVATSKGEHGNRRLTSCTGRGINFGGRYMCNIYTHITYTVR